MVYGFNNKHKSQWNSTLHTVGLNPRGFFFPPTTPHRHRMIFKSLIVLLVLFAQICVGCETPSSQVSALNDLYSSTNGKNWHNNSNWEVGDPCNNQWYGITCNRNCSVVSLDLSMNNLRGTIPSTIGNLIDLQILFMMANFNYLTGTIPSSIGRLIKLADINLGFNNLTGTIPSTISNLIHLGILNLYVNNLKGSIPSGIGNLVNLFTLDLHNNGLSGAIPSSVGALTNLLFLDFSYNNLSGTITPNVGNLFKLQQLWLRGNNLTGTLPPNIGKSINQLYLDHNQLTGTIPSSFVGRKYFDLDLSFNQLNGTVPWPINPNIPFFNASNNQFSCPLPSWCAPPPVGNGSCAPCVNATTSQLLCCYYSSKADATETTSCWKGLNCPTFEGTEIYGQAITSNCNQCTNNRKPT